jgi:DNA-binding MarR family transcriptional regulator
MDHDKTVEAVVRALRKVNWQGSILGQTVAIRLGLSESDVEALELLVDTGAETAGRLAELMGLTTGAVTRMIDRLEQAGYVRRTTDPADRRRVVVEPVAKRLGEIEPLLEGVGAITARELERYTPEQRELISGFLQRVTDAAQTETARLREPAAGAPLAGPMGGTDPQAPEAVLPAGAPDAVSGEHSAPLAGLSGGRLLVRGGAPDLTLRATRGIRTDGGAPALYRARFEGAMPVVRVRNGQVTVHYRGLFAWRGRRATMSLNADVPWDLEIQGGASRLTGDLADLNLRSLLVVGGASRLELTLGAPRGEVPVRVVGGATDLRLKRPGGAAVRLHVSGGMGKVEMDGRSAKAFGGDAVVDSDGAAAATDRYAVELVGGVGRVTIGRS